MDNRRGKPRARCKACTDEDVKIYRGEHPDWYIEYHARYYAEHKEHHNAITKRYQEEHKEYLAECGREWRLENKEHCARKKHENYMTNRDRILARHRLWDAANPKLKRLYSTRYKHSHPAETKARAVIYYSSPAGKQSTRLHNFKRRRLGHMPLNDWFDGAVFHHLRVLKSGKLDDDVGVFIPRELHYSVPHNRNNYDKINDLAISWVLGEGYRRASQLMDEIGWPDDQ